MAKLGKQKPGEQKYQSFTESDRVACAVVRHEKLCLRVDAHNQRLHGFAELRVVAPAKGVVGLHAQGLNIERVLYDGVPTEFEVIHTLKDDHYGDGNTLIVNQDHLSASDAADTAHARYLESLEKEMVPGLLVFVPELSVASHGNLDVPQTGSDAGTMKGVAGEKNGPESILEGPKEEVADHTEEKVKLVHVDYWFEKPESGAYFVGSMFHTSNQSCRARCWFPCVDLDFQKCSYEMEITVDSEFVAVSCGRPLYQVISKEGSHLKTYVYKLDIPVAARLVSLIVAPLEVLPDRQNISITHFCIPGSLVQLQCTSAFFHSAYSFYEDYLGASFPFGSYNLVFVDSESTMSSALVGAAITVLSSHLLVDEKVIDQTMNTRIKLAHSLAQQWFGVYISPETHNDAWLLEGLCIFLTDLFIKRHFGNNEMYYRRFKANEAVCKVDVNGAPPLCPCMNLFGTENIGGLGRIRSMKAAAVVQMLEKQMGPEAFRKILQRIILRAQDPVRNLRTLSTKEFRHFANKLGNLERPFLKDFFHRWVESPGCPVLRMGFVYSKRRNLIELAVHRGCTAVVDSDVESKGEAASERPRLTDVGWPGMMSIRVHELDGMFDHPSLPMAGDPHQLLEIHCHSKMAGRRIPRPKKGNKLEGAEEADQLPTAADGRQNVESPLLWVRADPQMEYLAEIQLQQPEQMWINQLEKDRDVVAQLQAITALSSLTQMSFTAVNALNHCLMDSKIFYRVRIEAAFALANTATEANGWVGLSHLIKLYKQRRYDPEIGLPRPNDFHDLAEYFVLQVIPGAVATIRGSDGKSPPEAVEFILQLLKHNDNSGNQFSDVYWLSSIIRSVGQLEFGQQGLQALQRILKRVDNFLQYDRIMPSYNNLITVSCIHTITELALKFSDLLPVGHVQQILNPFLDLKKVRWRVRAEVLKALVELEIHLKGLDSGIQLAIQLIDADQSPRVQNKVIAHTFRMCTLKENVAHTIQSVTLSQLLHLFQTRRAFNNTFMRHHIFSMLQVLGGRPATLFRIKRLEPKPPAKTEPAASIENTAPLAEAKVKAASFKVRLQPPQETPIEPVRIRLVSTGSQSLKESVPTMSGTSSGKQESDRKVGLLKLRLKPTSSAQETAFDTLRDKGLGSVPAQSSSMSVELGAKEANVIESPHSIMHVGVGSASVKEDSDDMCKIGSQKEPSSSNDVSAGKNGSMKRPCNASAQLKDSISKHQMSSLDAVVQRIVSEARGSPPEQELQAHVDESHGEQQSGHEDAILHSRLKLEEEGSSQVEPGDTNEVSHKSKKKQRVDGEHKDREKKRHREKDDSRQDDERGKRRDKHSDPEYLERKRLKKEKRREEQRRLLNADRDGASSTAKADLPLPLQQKPVTGTSETVVRLKIKKFQADN